MNYFPFSIVTPVLSSSSLIPFFFFPSFLCFDFSFFTSCFLALLQLRMCTSFLLYFVISPLNFASPLACLRVLFYHYVSLLFASRIWIFSSFVCLLILCFVFSSSPIYCFAPLFLLFCLLACVSFTYVIHQHSGSKISGVVYFKFWLFWCPYKVQMLYKPFFSKSPGL